MTAPTTVSDNLAVWRDHLEPPDRGQRPPARRDLPTRWIAAAVLVPLLALMWLAPGTGPDSRAARAADAFHAAFTPWVVSDADKAMARTCAVWSTDAAGVVVRNPTYDQVRCVALSAADTATHLAAVPAAEGGTCTLRSRHDCRAALGLPQTPDTALWWAPWETANGWARLALDAALGAVAALAAALVLGGPRLGWATRGTAIGALATLPGLWRSAGPEVRALTAVAVLGLLILIVRDAHPHARAARTALITRLTTWRLTRATRPAKEAHS